MYKDIDSVIEHYEEMYEDETVGVKKITKKPKIKPTNDDSKKNKINKKSGEKAPWKQES